MPSKPLARPAVAERVLALRDAIVERMVTGLPLRGVGAELARLHRWPVSDAMVHKYHHQALALIADECRAAHDGAVALLGPLSEAEEAEVSEMLAEPIEPAPERQVSTTLERYRRKPDARAPVIARP